MSEQYTFVGGIKDGSKVPDVFWILDTIEVVQHLSTGQHVIYYYSLNNEDRNWYLADTVTQDEIEDDCGDN
jgi:hypothetical protein